MATLDIPRQLRLLLTNSSDAPPLRLFLDNVNTLVTDCLDSQNAAGILDQFEEDLQNIYHEVIDHTVSSQIQIFLSVLYHLRLILPPVSIISTWFDLVLRPALREPKLPAEAVTHAKELVVSALSPVKQLKDAASDELEKEKSREKVKNFRRRLMDLYLLDAYNEISGEEVLEWAELNDAQKELKACWKANLEEVLVRVGLQRPQVGLALVRTPSQLHAELPAHNIRIFLPSYTTALHPLAAVCSC
jgi:hypothetical protein